VDIEDGRAVRVKGDPDNPVYQGYSCPRGRALSEQHAHPDRLLHSQKRDRDGRYGKIGSEQVMDEIAARVQEIIDAHGPRSVAIYIGTSSNQYVAAAAAGVGWLIANGSRMVFSAATIDQPGKHIANALHGRWLGGGYLYDEADTWLLLGTNPIVSMVGNVSCANPARSMTDARKRGLELIVIDPRRTEASRYADLYLQPRPGEDPTLLAGMLNVILEERLFDREFVEGNTQNFAALRAIVSQFDPAYAANRAGVAEEDLVEAAHLFAAGRRAAATAGTGPNMAPRGTLTEYLLLCMNTVCGNWRREGEALPNPGVLMPEAQAFAQAEPPRKGWGFGETVRIRDLENSAAGLPTGALAEEMLLEGDGRIRALVCIGGNPAVAWPDQNLTVEALGELDLLVTIDMKMSATAKLADYVIAPKLSFETPATTIGIEAPEQTWPNIGYSRAYGQYTPALVDPPAGSDLVEEWSFFYGLARRQRLPLTLYPVRAEAGPLRELRKPLAIDMEAPPTTDELIELQYEGSRVALSELKQHPGGGLFDDPPTLVQPRQSGWQGRLELGDESMLADLAEVREETAEVEAAYPLRLISRRIPGVYNSAGRDLPHFRRKATHNAAYVHPDDLAALGLASGSTVRIESEHASIPAVVEAADDLRPGVVSMTHAFGDTQAQDARFREIGSNTNRLIDTRSNFDRYSGIPRMSAIPVRIIAAE
jgi:anaerobic selenocysteine-containing dehydrogenase